MIRWLLLLLSITASSCYAAPQCAFLANNWNSGLSFQFSNATVPPLGMTACPIVYMTGGDFTTYAGTPQGINPAATNSTCANQINAGSGWIQVTKTTTPLGGLGACQYVFFPGYEYESFRATTLATPQTSLSDVLLMTFGLFFAAMLGFKTGFRP